VLVRQSPIPSRSQTLFFERDRCGKEFPYETKGKSAIRRVILFSHVVTDTISTIPSETLIPCRNYAEGKRKVSKRNAFRRGYPAPNTTRRMLITIKVKYFMEKRIMDKRRELMYADGIGALPDKSVAQPNSK
jgi:hypothetical protein